MFDKMFQKREEGEEETNSDGVTKLHLEKRNWVLRMNC
jgi:hypothetical protein